MFGAKKIDSAKASIFLIFDALGVKALKVKESRKLLSGRKNFFNELSGRRFIGSCIIISKLSIFSAGSFSLLTKPNPGTSFAASPYPALVTIVFYFLLLIIIFLPNDASMISLYFCIDDPAPFATGSFT